MATGAELTELAESRLKEKYANVLVPKNNPNWHGPWDSAEFASWIVYQLTERLYGCINNSTHPARTQASVGAWVRDAELDELVPASEDEAAGTPGLFLIRRPPLPGTVGHVAISDGRGGTIEAAGAGLGVRRGKVRGRLWHYVVKIPGVRYGATGYVGEPKPLPPLLTLETPPLRGPLVRRVQVELECKGFDPGPIDGRYGPQTVAAVAAFQALNRLVADGVCGPSTARKLGIEWPARRLEPVAAMAAVELVE